MGKYVARLTLSIGSSINRMSFLTAFDMSISVVAGCPDEDEMDIPSDSRSRVERDAPPDDDRFRLDDAKDDAADDGVSVDSGSFMCCDSSIEKQLFLELSFFHIDD